MSSENFLSQPRGIKWIKNESIERGQNSGGKKEAKEKCNKQNIQLKS